jgi:hypothetical protein
MICMHRSCIRIFLLDCPCLPWLSVDIGVSRYRVVERLRVGNMCLYTYCYWRLILDKIETGRDHLGGTAEHSKGKGGERVMAISRFLCGSPHLCQLRTE